MLSQHEKGEEEAKQSSLPPCNHLEVITADREEFSQMASSVHLGLFESNRLPVDSSQRLITLKSLFGAFNLILEGY